MYTFKMLSVSIILLIFFIQGNVQQKYERKDLTSLLNTVRSKFKVIVLLGPHDVGKTFIIQEVFKDLNYANLKNITTQKEEDNNSVDFLTKYQMIDEIHSRPQLVFMISELIKITDQTCQYVLSGSISYNDPDIYVPKKSFKIHDDPQFFTITVPPLTLKERGINFADRTNLDQAIVQGASCFFEPAKRYSYLEIRNYYKNYFRKIENDFMRYYQPGDFKSFIKIFRSIAGMYMSREFNEKNVAKLLSNTVENAPSELRKMLSRLEKRYLIHDVNNFERYFDTPKVYIADTGIICYLLGVNPTIKTEYEAHFPYIFENMVYNELYARLVLQDLETNIFYYKRTNQSDIDFIVLINDNMIVLEVKSTRELDEKKARKITDDFRSLNYFYSQYSSTAIKFYIVYPGTERFTFNNEDYNITILPIRDIEDIFD